MPPAEGILREEQLAHLMGRGTLDQMVVVSKVIQEGNRRPLLVYRRPPQSPNDSGWTATAGESPEDIKSASFGVAHMRHLIERWPELVAVFADARDESAWAWDHLHGRYVEVAS